MSAPKPTDLLGEMYAAWAVEMNAHPAMSLALLRFVFDDWHRATAEPEDVTYEHTSIGGVPGILVKPIGSDPKQMHVFMHGGGFALGSSSSHRKLAGHLAKECGTYAFVLDFRLAPENPYPSQIDDGVAVIKELVKQGLRIQDITPVGDSAGGNLAISMVLSLRNEGHPLPGQVLTMSPWLNMENTGITIETNDATDFLIAREGLQANIDRYLGDVVDPKDPMVNALYADLSGFPRLYICAGDVESLFDDSCKLNDLATMCGVDVTFSVGKNMQHVYPFLAGRLPRADEEIALMGNWYRKGRATN